jgi:aspartyl-tRNA(Asn)/glutamyl-tRNA(Gln) amidotransferase subunit A
MQALVDGTIGEAASRLADGSVSSEELTEACLARIRARNARINAFITVCDAEALEGARVADRERAAGRYIGPLHGIPISLKDLIDQAGVLTTAASRVLAGNVARGDAEIVKRLRAQGAILIGKTNLHEFAYGTTSEESAYGPVRNPLDTTRSAGGSSGGSAAAVVSGMGFASIGTDTGGSIRIPAAACGCVGLKPTYGEIPCDGVIPLSPSLDHVGPVARSVADAALLYLALRGTPRVVAPEVPRGGRAPRVGLLRGYFLEAIDHDVSAAFTEAVSRLAAAGATVLEREVPGAADTSDTYFNIQLPEASASHAATLERNPNAYSQRVRERLELGRKVAAEDYVLARRRGAGLTEEVDRALDGCDVLALPALPIPAPIQGTESLHLGDRDYPVRALMLRLTQLFDVTGHPAISLPCGKAGGGLPVGMQLVGRRMATPALLSIALWCERRLDPAS